MTHTLENANWFTAFPSEGIVECPHCRQATDVAAWTDCEPYCEDCGTHAGIRCPACEQCFDHVWSADARFVKVEVKA